MLPAVSGIGRRFSDSVAAFAAVWRNANLRWLELAWAASIVGHYAFLVAVSVYAYDVGGEKAVGLVFLARLIPAALIAPFAGMLGDRYPRERVLLLTNVSRVVLVGAAAVAVFADARSVGRVRARRSPRRSRRRRSARRRPRSRRRSHERPRSSPRRTPSRAASRASPSSPARLSRACSSASRARESSSRSRRCSSSCRRSSSSSSDVAASRATTPRARGVDDRVRAPRGIHDARPRLRRCA